MKLLFVHDGTLKYDHDGRYYGTAVTPYSLSRYKYLSDDITIVIRAYPFKDGESRSRYMEIPSEYKIVHVDNYMTLKGMLFQKRIVEKRLVSIIKEMDLVIARFSGPTGKIAFSICNKMNKPCIVECVGCAWDSFWNYNLKGKFLAPFLFFAQKRLIKQAKYVIYVTNQFLQRRYPTNGKSINASNVELLSMQESVLNNRLKHLNADVNKKTLVLGTASAIDVKYKGQAYVMEAMSILKKEGYRFVYQIAGAGDKGYLEGQAKKYGVEDDVQFMGVMPHEKVFEWMDNLDIYIQPSDQEGLPRALIEAMSRACPAIGSTTAGIPELLSEDAIFTRKKVPTLVKVLRDMEDKTLRIKQAKRNYQTALGYQRETIYARRNVFFDEVLTENHLAK